MVPVQPDAVAENEVALAVTSVFPLNTFRLPLAVAKLTTVPSAYANKLCDSLVRNADVAAAPVTEAPVLDLLKVWLLVMFITCPRLVFHMIGSN